MTNNRELVYWWQYIKRRWPIYFWGVLTVLLCNLMQVLVARSTGWLLDFFANHSIPNWLTGQSQEATFIKIFLVILFARIFLTFNRWGWRITLARETHWAASILRSELWRKARFLPREILLEELSKGKLMSISTSDLGVARMLFGFILVGLVDIIFLGISTLVAMSMIDMQITIFALVALLAIPIFVGRLGKREIANYNEAQEYLSDFNDLAGQSVGTIKLQRVSGRANFWTNRLNEFSKIYRGKRLKAAKTSLFYIPLMGIFTMVTYFIMFGFGIKKIFDGSMTIGNFVAMQGLIFLLQDPLMGLGFVISDWKRAMASLKRFLDVIDLPAAKIFEEHDKKIEVNKENEATPALEIQDFKVKREDGAVLINIPHLQLFKGDRLGIIGPIGTGKTTFIDSMMGLRNDYEGSAKIWGVELNKLNRQEFCQLTGHVPQRPFLFATTIRDNMTLDRKLSDEEIFNYLEMAGIAEDIRKLPLKLETGLGEWGINLSGGQKQRLTLARALARNPKLLFLDDCLSAVDTSTEEKILHNLENNLKDTVIVWVAHRQSTLRSCNKKLEFHHEVQ